MSNQLIIALGREFGSGGHEIARALAGRFDLPLYDKNMLEQIAQAKGMDVSKLAPYDETPKNYLMHRTVNGYSNAPGVVIAQMQFQYLRERADSGESFVVLGRCADEVLQDYPGLITVFIMADVDFKTQRVMERGADTEAEARQLMAKEDRKRRVYHNQFSKGKWGDPNHYDLIVNSARLGIEGTTDFLEQYIRARVAQMASETP